MSRLYDAFVLRLNEGEVAAIAAQCPDRHELARRLGLSPRALYNFIARARADGLEIPPCAGKSATMHTATVQHTETSPRPSMPDDDGFDLERWPNLAAFDDIPLEAIPEGHRVWGVSTLIDAEGGTVQQWIKTKADSSEVDAWVAAARSVGPDVPRSPIAPPPVAPSSRTMSIIPMGDPHIGLICDALISGEDWDTEKAEEVFYDAIDRLVSLSPPSDEAIVIDCGDSSTIDSMAGTTTAGTKQDSDLWTRIVRVILRLRRRITNRLLEKHERVSHWIVPGNHDTHTAFFSAQVLAAMFENNPRVSVPTHPGVIHHMRWGANQIAAHHGHKIKGEALPLRIAVDFPEDWGKAKHRHIYTGHIHHETVKEMPGARVKSCNTLAAPDKYHRDSGYRSMRFMDLEVLDIEHGLVRMERVSIDVIRRERRVKAEQYTPVRMKRGSLVHAMPQSGLTLCPAPGPFVIADAVVDCVGCLEAIVTRAKAR